MRSRFAIAWLCAVALAAAPCLAQRDYSKVEIQVTKLSETVYVLKGAGGNIGLSIGEDAVFLIDDQYAPLTEKIVAAIAKLTPKPVGFILNTHWHPDHTGGNPNLGKAGALIVAHENVRKRLSADQFVEAWRTTFPALPKAGLPVVTFTGSVSFHLNGEEIRAIHVPRAHTDGDAVVHFLASDVIHMGDLYWAGMYPFVDTGSGGTMDGMIAGIDQVLAIAGDGTRIIPGHGGPVSNRAELSAYRNMLATITGRVRKLIAEGRQIEEITASGVTREFDQQWGKANMPGEKFAEMIAMNLLKSREK